MSIVQLFAGETANNTSSTTPRNGDLVKTAIFKYSKTGTGTCTLEFKDGDTDAVLSTFSVLANAQQDADTFDMTRAGFAEVSAVSGVVVVTAFLDGS